MMFLRSLSTIALFAVSAKLVSATPPACLLGAVNTQPNPADLKAICGPNASKVESQIRSQCGANTGAAMSAFTSICSSSGYHVVTANPSTTKKSTTAKATKTKEHSQSHKTKSTAKSATTAKSHHTTKAHHTTKKLLSATGGHQGAQATGTTVTTPSAPAASASNGPKSYPGAAGRVDADGFAALALAAAGLAVFL